MKRSSLRSMVLAGVLMAAPAFLKADVPAHARESANLAKKVRHELVMLPFYSVFDNLAFEIDGSKVILFGQVTRPTLKTDSERAVKRIEGVTAVENRIEVLPVSTFDDRTRLRLYYAIYGHDSLLRYSLVPLAPIRIIVKNGEVMLEGVVANEMDRNLAGLAANGVFGVFRVTNNLRVSKA